MAINFGLSQQPDYLAELQERGRQQQLALQAQRFAVEQQERNRIQASRGQTADLAARGDYVGARQSAAAAGDFQYGEALGKLDDDQRARFKEGAAALGSAAQDVFSRPEQEQGAAWAAHRGILKQYGFDDHELDDIGSHPERLRAAAAAGLTAAQQLEARDRQTRQDLDREKFDFERNKVTYHSVPEGGFLQGTYADGRLAGGSPAPQSAAAAPPGSGGATALDGNNPGGINDGEFARSQPGYQGSNGRYARFGTLRAGEDAQRALLRSYIARGFDTPAKIAQRWAPAGDGRNDPTAYAANVARQLGVGVNDRLTADDVDRFQTAQARQENSMYRGTGGAPVQNAAVAGRIYGAPKRDNAPSGYRTTADGNLEAIPGGPGDPNRSGNRGADRKTEGDLRKEFDGLPEVKSAKAARVAYGQVLALAEKQNATAQDDIAAIFSFMKTLDPSSTVREGEFATAQNAAGVPEQIRNAYSRALSGNRLSRQQRIQIANTAGTFYAKQRDQYNIAADQYRGYADSYGVSPDNVARKYVRIGGRSNPVRVSSPEEARRLAPGTVFITPDGRSRTRH